MTNIAMENPPIFKFGKPSISIRAIYTMAMLVITRGYIYIIYIYYIYIPIIEYRADVYLLGTSPHPHQSHLQTLGQWRLGCPKPWTPWVPRPAGLVDLGFIYG